MKRLYRVTVELAAVVLADSEDEALEIMAEHDLDGFMPNDEAAYEIESIADAGGWVDAVPFNGADGKTVRQILEER